jgi:hypothetical protein
MRHVHKIEPDSRRLDPAVTMESIKTRHTLKHRSAKLLGKVSKI